MLYNEYKKILSEESFKDCLVYKCSKGTLHKRGLDDHLVSYLKDTIYSYYQEKETDTWRNKVVPLINARIKLLFEKNDSN